MSVRQAVKMRAVPWWLLLLEGIALIILGILFLTNPGSTSLAVVTVLGLYWLISGILGIIGIFLNSHNWFWKLILGIVGIIAGILILQHPLTSTVVVGSALVLWMGILGLIIGIMNIIRAFTGEGWGVGILGVISAILGIVLLANFWGVTFSLPWTLGILSLIGGFITIINSFRARGIQKDMEAGTDELTNKMNAASTQMDAAATRAATAVSGAASGAGAAAAAAGAAGVAAASRAGNATVDAAGDVADAAGDAVGATVDAAGDVASDAADAVSGAVDATVDAAGDAADAVGDALTGTRAAAMAGAVNYKDADLEAIQRWAKDKGITQADLDKFMASPYADLLARGKTPQERAALAAEMGVDTSTVLEWLNRLDLERVKGIGPVYANLLEQAGVDTVKELAQRNPANLQAKLEEVNATAGLTERVPTEAEVTEWINQAKDMPRGLEY